MKTIVLTAGEPSGIGPDILVQLAQKKWPVRLVACIDPDLLQERAKILGLKLNLYLFNEKDFIQPKQSLMILPVKLFDSVVCGKLNKKNSPYVIETLNQACLGCIKGDFSALVTGPIHKGIINDFGIDFIGHTEFLEFKSKAKKAVMMFVKENFRLALVTTHIPLKKVSEEITFKNLSEVILVLNSELYSKFKIKNPAIYICGLNPHAGENGYIGTEEIDTIIPVITKLKLQGMNLHGPFPADSLLQRKYFHKADVILAMYHDQALSVIKYDSFNYNVNITLGLPFIRTSVDHGTALDLAGTGKSNPKSYILALKLAIKIIKSIK